jgi:hypothetical protein
MPLFNKGKVNVELHFCHSFCIIQLGGLLVLLEFSKYFFLLRPLYLYTTHYPDPLIIPIPSPVPSPFDISVISISIIFLDGTLKPLQTV